MAAPGDFQRVSTLQRQRRRPAERHGDVASAQWWEQSYYDPFLTLAEMNPINTDWFTSINARRQNPQEVLECCAEFGLSVDHLDVQEAGVTIIATNRG